MRKRYIQISAVAAAAAMAVGCASAPKPAPADSTPVAAEQAAQSAPSQTIQALGDMEALRLELAALRNEVEIQRNELDKLQRRQRQLYDDLDYRLRERERGPAPPAAGYQTPGAPPTAPPGYAGRPGFGAQPGAAQQAQGAPSAVIPEYAEPQTGIGQAAPAAGATAGMSAESGASMPPTAATSGTAGQVAAAPPPGAVTPPPVIPPAQTVTVASAEEQAAYDGAFELLKQSRYGEAVDAFRGVALQFPNGALADDAQYWVGEAMYVTRDFPGALDAFRTVVERFPASPRVPEALLKVGYVQYEMGNLAQAQMTLSEVISRFPGSRVAISAQTRLRKIEQGG